MNSTLQNGTTHKYFYNLFYLFSLILLEKGQPRPKLMHKEGAGFSNQTFVIGGGCDLSPKRPNDINYQEYPRQPTIFLLIEIEGFQKASFTPCFEGNDKMEKSVQKIYFIQ